MSVKFPLREHESNINQPYSRKRSERGQGNSKQQRAVFPGDKLLATCHFKCVTNLPPAAPSWRYPIRIELYQLKQLCAVRPMARGAFLTPLLFRNIHNTLFRVISAYCRLWEAKADGQTCLGCAAILNRFNAFGECEITIYARLAIKVMTKNK